MGKIKDVLVKNDGEIKIYPSIRKAANAYGYSVKLVNSCVKSGEPHDNLYFELDTDENTYLRTINDIFKDVDKYSFDKIKFTDYNDPVIITCTKHNHDFEIIAHKLLRRKNADLAVGFCPLCKEDYYTDQRDNMFDVFREIYDNKYEYDADSYINCEKSFNIICPEHGAFRGRIGSKKGRSHTQCPKCPKTRTRNGKKSNVVWIDGVRHFNCKKHGNVEIGKKRNSKRGCPVCNKQTRKIKDRELRQKSIISNLSDKFVIFFNNQSNTVSLVCKKHKTKEIFAFDNLKFGGNKKKHFCEKCKDEDLDEIGRKKGEKTKKRIEDRVLRKIEEKYSHLYEFVTFDGDKVIVLNIVNNKEEEKHKTSFLCGSLTTNKKIVSERLLSNKILSFEEARERVQKLKITTFREYKHWRKKLDIENMPAHPNRVYKNKGFISYYDFFGTTENAGSLGERRIEAYLKNREIKYEREKTFPGCVNKRNLRFDFYLPDYNLIIEFDGDQHNKFTENFGMDSFLNTQINDDIKNEYCKDNNIHLERIEYSYLTENQLETRLRFIISRTFEKNGYDYV